MGVQTQQIFPGTRGVALWASDWGWVQEGTDSMDAY